MPDPAGESGQLERMISSAANIVAPISVISGLLFYFGYASSRAQYEYFGIDVDTIGLSTQDYVMRSPQPLMVPLLLLALFGIAFSLGHGLVRRRIDTAQAAADDESDAVAVADGRRRLVAARRIARAAVLAGDAALAAGVALLFSYSRLGDWGPYPLVTALLLASGAGA